MCVLRGGIADFSFQSQQIGRICSGPVRPRDGVIAHTVMVNARNNARAREVSPDGERDTKRHTQTLLRSPARRNATPQVRVKLPSYTSWCQLVRARRKEACVQRESFLNAEAWGGVGRGSAWPPFTISE